MWVGKVARSIDLVGTYLAQELYDDVDICLCELALLDTSSLVEGEVEEVGVGIGVEAEGAHRSARFSTAYSTLDVEELAGLRLATTLFLDGLLYILVAVTEAELACCIYVL